MSVFYVHLKALLYKNVILLKRNWLGTFCQIFIPIIFIIAFSGLKNVFVDDVNPQQSYIQNTTLNKTKKYFAQSYGTPSNFNTAYSTGGNFTLLRLKLFQSNYFINYPFTQAVALGPSSNTYISEVQSLFQTMGFTTKIFASKADLDNYVKQDDYLKQQQLGFGVFFKETSSSTWDYDMIYNITQSVSRSSLYPTFQQRVISVGLQGLQYEQKYRNTGFFIVQNLIDTFILQKVTSDSSAVIKNSVTSQQIQAYTSSEFLRISQYNIDFYCLLPLIYIFTKMIFKIVQEKEEKIREGMKMMGMKNDSFYLSWFIIYFANFLIISFINSLVFTTLVLTKQNFIFIFILYILFSLVLIFMAFFVSVFFTKAKSAQVVGIVLFLAFYFVISILGQEEYPESILTVASISPYVAGQLGLKAILFFQTNDKTMDFEGLSTMINGWCLKNSYYALMCHILFWSVTALYLDQVFPNEFGAKKHPLFFLDFLFKKQKLDNIKENQVVDNDNVEEIDAMLKQQEEKQQVTKLTNLTHIYPGGKLAVNQLNLTMYSGQIFCLLGGNGAGKTTTISMLTGLLNITNGSANVFGTDVGTNLDELRKIMGVCPQFDFLYQDLTIREHLILYGKFKGSDLATLDQEVETMIKNLSLTEKADQLVKTLSGGQKRRLSTGIAFIGNSKFIVLDEPTSGMDTSARRDIWEILKNFKNDKIILLTTHFMDEADYLGDRIAIMKEGNLQCVGSSVFLKNKFGAGYNLTIVKKVKEVVPEIHDLVNKYIPEVQTLQEVSSEVIFQLPIKYIDKFQELFKQIDEQLEKLKIESYGVGITTLEEVFIRITKNQVNLESNNELQMIKVNSNHYEDIDNYDFQKNRITNPFSKFWTHFLAINVKRFQFLSKDKKGLFCEFFLPIIALVLGCYIATIQFLVLQPSVPFNLSYYQSQNILYASSVSQADTKTILDNANFKSTPYYPNANSYYNITQWDNKQFSQKNLNNLASFYFTQADISSKSFNYINIYNTIAPEAGAIFNNLIDEAIIRTASGNSNFRLKATLTPFPLTSNQLKLSNNIAIFLSASLFSIALGFIPSTIVSFIVKENRLKIKHQQMVQGVGVFTYWFSNFFLDIIKYWLFAGAGLIFIQAFEIDSMAKEPYFEQIVLLFVLYGFCMLPFTYFMNFFFLDHGDAQNTLFQMYNLSGTILATIVFVLRLFETTRSVANIIGYVLRFFPPYLFGSSIVDIGSYTTLASINGRKPSDVSLYEMEYNGENLIMIAVNFGIYTFLIFLYEKIQSTQNPIQQFTSKKVPYVQKEYDSDVQDEMNLIQSEKPENYSIYVNNLRKVYDTGKVAVDKISLGIKKGDVFGLLGVNGAGKTTTFKMLTGDVIPTQGDAYINGYDLSKYQHKANDQIGYCPQFDGLLEFLTVKEHLDLYASIRCIPKSVRNQAVEFKIKELDLIKYKNVQSKDLSGGNKRKLQVAMAMLGNPNIIFLDEPSTGMDVGARRFMWDVISRVATQKKQSCIILTTHSMEEAEALCTRMGIMVNGEFKCLGSVQHIKSKFGKGLELEIKTQTSTADEIKVIEDSKFKIGTYINIQAAEEILSKYPILLQEFQTGRSQYLKQDIVKNGSILSDLIYSYIIQEDLTEKLQKILQQSFSNVNLIEHFLSFYRFKMDNNKSIGNVFGFLQQNKSQLKITNYSIKQATIEQIFNTFARDQISEEDDFNALKASQIKL